PSGTPPPATPAAPSPPGGAAPPGPPAAGFSGHASKTATSSTAAALALTPARMRRPTRVLIGPPVGDSPLRPRHAHVEAPRIRAYRINAHRVAVRTVHGLL